jgi:uncharacterized phage-associated protein
MTASAHDVAAAIRERLPAVGKKKLHKLLYYCQGHHLATFGRPLFTEQIYAWDMGPVVKALWREENYGDEPPAPHVLSEGELNTVGYVVSQYGALTGDQLERLTHTEHPWLAGNERRLVGDSDRIEQAWIRSYFADSARRAHDDDEDAADAAAVQAWLSATRPPTELPQAKPDTAEGLRARLARD